MGRKSVNTILEGQLYQRGQMLTWPREDKVAMLQTHPVKVVVNFWPKMDAEWSDLPLAWYLYVPTARSQDMLGPPVMAAARAIAAWLKTPGAGGALILCEAGKTRSVFFCTLVLVEMGWPAARALQHMQQVVPANQLKPFMLDHLSAGVAVAAPPSHRRAMV